MHKEQTIEKTYKGTWKEVLSLRDEIPETSEVEVKVWIHHDESEWVESRRKFRAAIDELIAKAEVIADAENDETDESDDDLYRKSLKEKFSRMGLKV